MIVIMTLITSTPAHSCSCVVDYLRLVMGRELGEGKLGRELHAGRRVVLGPHHLAPGGARAELGAVERARLHRLLGERSAVRDAVDDEVA